MSTDYTIGVDFGTDSVRAILADSHSGKLMAKAVFDYPRWKKRLYCNPDLDQFRQHPLDYIEGLTYTIKACLAQVDDTIPANIRAISMATTGSTPVAVDVTGKPLALDPAFAEDPDAMFILWKDHTGVREADEITQHAKKCMPNYVKYTGGSYSPEWFWSKALHISRKNKKVASACFTWVEHCDWMPFLLIGAQRASDIKRSACAAGHKALWAKAHGGYPPAAFFNSIDPMLETYAATLNQEVFPADQCVGKLSKEWANSLGLSEDVLIGVGALDAHMGAVGGQIEPYYLSKEMGTSTCDMLVLPKNDSSKVVNGICGQVEDSIIPGFLGLEAGQSAFGDVYTWFKNLISWPLNHMEEVLDQEELALANSLKEKIVQNILPELSKKAAAMPFNEESEIAVDWFNGRRTPYVNMALKAAITNISLASNAPRLFRAVVEATCFGSKKIVRHFNDSGVQIKGIVALGGIAKKSPFVLQMLADILQLPIRTHRSEQTCAAGAAMFAATVAGIYPGIEHVMNAMGEGFDHTYYPNPKLYALYDARYKKFLDLGSHIVKPYIKAGSFG